MTTRREIFTFPDSGHTIQIERPLMSQASIIGLLMREYPRPEPPKQVVKIAGQEVLEPNPASPDYARELSTWNASLMSKVGDILISEGALSLVELDDGERAEAAAMRGRMGRYMDLSTLTDEEVWLRFIAISSDEDMRALTTAIQRLGQPTEAAINGQVKQFQPTI